jgi:hypothetical protein
MSRQSKHRRKGVSSRSRSGRGRGRPLADNLRRFFLTLIAMTFLLNCGIIGGMAVYVASERGRLSLPSPSSLPHPDDLGIDLGFLPQMGRAQEPESVSPDSTLPPTLIEITSVGSATHGAPPAPSTPTPVTVTPTLPAVTPVVSPPSSGRTPTP